MVSPARGEVVLSPPMSPNPHLSRLFLIGTLALGSIAANGGVAHAEPLPTCSISFDRQSVTLVADRPDEVMAHYALTASGWGNVSYGWFRADNGSWVHTTSQAAPDPFEIDITAAMLLAMLSTPGVMATAPQDGQVILLQAGLGDADTAPDVDPSHTYCTTSLSITYYSSGSAIPTTTATLPVSGAAARETTGWALVIVTLGAGLSLVAIRRRHVH